MKKYILVFFMALILGLISSIHPVYALNDTASSSIVMDISSGRILYEKNSHSQRLIASTTKIMTCILAIENGNLDDTVQVGEEVLKMYGSNIYLELGEKMTLKDLLYGMMLRSGNDAATVIATYIGKDQETFVEMMNQKAKEIGMRDTIFRNPTGLDDYEENYSTAYDMALLSKYAYQNETYREIVGTEKYRVEGEKLYIWNNRNELLKTYDYATGGKTGYTPRAGHTLVTTASYNGLDLTAVTLNDGNMYLNQEEMYDYAFSNYERITILDKDHFEVSDNYYQDKIYIKNSFQYPLTKEEQEEITTLLSLTKKTKLKDGDEVGKVEVYLNDEKIHEEPVFVEIKKKRTFLDFLKDLF